MVDVVIENGLIVDGTGAPPFEGTVLVEGGRIRVLRGASSAAAATAGIEGAERVDATGLVVAPGIVDLHTHSDVSNLSEPHAISAIEQGVTTQIVGLCGFSAGPITDESLRTMVDEEPVFGFPDVDWSWRTIGGYLERVNEVGVATNTVTLVGHSTLRRSVMGSDQRGPTPAELREMQDKLREGIREGARGFSTGLSYAPGTFATIEELTELTSRRGRGGLAVPHAHALRRVDRAPSRWRRRSPPPNDPASSSTSRTCIRGPVDAPDAADRLIDMIEARTCPRHARDVGHDRLSAWRRGMGPVAAALGARRRHGGHAGTAGGPRRPAPDPRVPRSATPSSRGRHSGTTS